MRFATYGEVSSYRSWRNFSVANEQIRKLARHTRISLTHGRCCDYPKLLLLSISKVSTDNNKNTVLFNPTPTTCASVNTTIFRVNFSVKEVFSAIQKLYERNKYGTQTGSARL